MAYTTIDDPSVYFQTTLYAGDGSSSNAITNGGNSDLQPDWIWIKDRSATNGHGVQDTSRGIAKVLFTNGTDSEDQYTNTMVSSVQSDGFTVPNNSNSNTNTNNYVAWQWKANGGTTTSFTESGDNPGGTYQANTTAGFSIVRFIGTGANGTVQHGLGVAPQWIIHKRTDSGSSNWITYHNSVGTGHNLFLNENNAKDSDGALYFQNTAPTSSVFTAGGYSQLNENNSPTIAYCFTPIQGYSKFGSYTGNGNEDGPMVYLGFKPAWLMIKRTDTANSWYLVDGTRGPTNVVSAEVEANITNAEATDNVRLDILSNGFKIRTSGAAYNASGGDYIYMCFAENPFVSSEGIPATAR